MGKQHKVVPRVRMRQIAGHTWARCLRSSVAKKTTVAFMRATVHEGACEHILREAVGDSRMSAASSGNRCDETIISRRTATRRRKLRLRSLAKFEIQVGRVFRGFLVPLTEDPARGGRSRLSQPPSHPSFRAASITSIDT